MQDKTYIDLTEHQGPLYLCDWDGGGVTEIHTAESLRAKYEDSGLYESGGWGSPRHWDNWSFSDVIAYMDEEPDDRTMFRSSNMTIQRIR